MNSIFRYVPSRLPLVASAVLAAVGGWLAFAPAAGPRPAAGGVGPAEAVSVAAPTRPLTRPIESIRVGDRVLGANPDRAEVDPAEADPDGTWRAVDVYQAKPGGGVLYATLLRPPAWVAEHVRGGRVDLDRPELGAEGPADVLAVSPGPAIGPGAGRVVTGTFRHQAGGELVRVRAGGDAVVCTAGHRFWSESAGAFVPARDLRAGDVVRTRAAGLAPVEAVEPAGPAGWVYNLEVAGEHVYEVGTTGLLAHNDGCGLTQLTAKRPQPPGGLKDNERALSDFILKNKTHIHVYKPGEGKGLGDFVFVHMGNGKKLVGMAVELKNTRVGNPKGFEISRATGQVKDSALGQAKDTLGLSGPVAKVKLTANEGWKGVDMKALMKELNTIFRESR